jgi:head-tail adaptor
MNPGQFDRRITIQNASEAVDSQGTSVKTWGTYAQRWARKESTTSDTGESYDAEQRQAFRGVKWYIRWDATTKAITENMRVLDGSEVYDIDSIQEVTTDRRTGYLELMTIKRGRVDA